MEFHPPHWPLLLSVLFAEGKTNLSRYRGQRPINREKRRLRFVRVSVSASVRSLPGSDAHRHTLHTPQDDLDDLRLCFDLIRHRNFSCHHSLHCAVQPRISAPGNTPARNHERADFRECLPGTSVNFSTMRSTGTGTSLVTILSAQDHPRTLKRAHRACTHAPRTAGVTSDIFMCSHTIEWGTLLPPCHPFSRMAMARFACARM